MKRGGGEKTRGGKKIADAFYGGGRANRRGKEKKRTLGMAASTFVLGGRGKGCLKRDRR